MDGAVVTFYSYKGGVGRSFTLSNIAILLARWGHRVLTIDWDLEAPGLHEYFAPLLAVPPDVGLVDIVDDFVAGGVRPTSAYVTHLDAGEAGVVDLLAAGRQDDGYARRVQGIDWAELYERGFADVLEQCRKDWVAKYDFVLIDSRTGWADIASICTAHLPDLLVVVFTANEQSVNGAVAVARRADEARDRMPYDRPRLSVLPILSRFDSRVEYERAETWYRTCADLTKPLFENWLVRHVPHDLMLRHLTLPYVSYWSFGEQLPVRAEQTPSTDQIAYALETVAAIVAHRFDRTDLLADNRDAYVAASRGQEHHFGLDVLVSSPRSAQRIAAAVVEELRAHGLRAERSLSGDLDLLDRAKDAARHLCLVIDGQVSRWQTAEAEWFLRRALTGDGDRRLFPVLTSATRAEALPGFLRNLRSVEIGPGGDARAAARRLHGELGGTAPSPDTEPYTHAVTAIRRVRDSVLDYDGWYLVERRLRAIAAAVDGDDLPALRRLTRDLEEVRTTGQGVARHDAPENVVGLAEKLISDINWKTRKRSLPR